MNVQWYPGHMTKAKRQMQEDIKLIDLIIELVDARVPLSSRNPDIDELGKNKARMILLNKADLADERQNRAWMEYFKEKGIYAVSIDSRNKGSMKAVSAAITEACKEKTERDRRRGIKNRPVRAMVAGIPNVGKSTLISVVSNAQPEIANYEFTTLTPKLGVVVTDDFRSYVMADIPGIIEGASEGKGLGIEFLRHIERTKFLLFMVDLANYRDLKEQYYTLKQELRKFSEKLALRDYAIALTRCDTLSPEETNEKVDQFLKLLGLEANKLADKYKVREDLHTYCQDVHERERALPFFVMPISSVSKINIDPIKYALSDVITKVRDEKSSC